MSEHCGPPCVGIGCDKPVSRVTGRKIPKRGKRMVDGIHWGWFCSRACSGRDKGHVSMDACRRVGRMNRQRAERRIIQRLVEASRDVMDKQGRVDARDMVKVMMLELRKAYARGMTALCRQRERAA